MESTLRSRHELLAALCEEPLTKPELADRVSVSRSTVDRAVKDLQLCECIEATGSRYRVTETGRLALEAYRSYRGTLETIEAASPVLDSIPTGSIGFQFLRGATVDRPHPRAPLRVLEESRKLLYDARRLRGTGLIAFDQHLEHIEESVANGGLTCELLLDRELYESFEDAQREALREAIRPDGGTLLVTSLEGSFTVWLIDDGSTEHAGITVYEDNGIAGIIRNDDPAAVEWVREQYRERKADAEVVWDFG